jgi:hypothetical protein
MASAISFYYIQYASRRQNPYTLIQPLRLVWSVLDRGDTDNRVKAAAGELHVQRRALDECQNAPAMPCYASRRDQSVREIDLLHIVKRRNAVLRCAQRGDRRRSQLPGFWLHSEGNLGGACWSVWRTPRPQEQSLGRISKIRSICKDGYCQVVPTCSDGLFCVHCSVCLVALILTTRQGETLWMAKSSQPPPAQCLIRYY